MMFLLPVLLLNLFSGTEVNAQWVPKAGEGVLIIGPRVSYSSSFFDANGNRISSLNDGEFYKVEIGGYFSIGIGNGFGVFTGFSFADLSYTDNFVKEKSGGFSNPTIGIIKQFTDYPDIITSASLTVTPPLNFPKNEKPELGGEFWEFETGGLIGKGYEKFYLTGQLYYRYKDNINKESQIKIIGGGGVSLSEKIDFFTGLEYVKSFNFTFNSLKYSGTLLYKFNKMFGLGLGSEYIITGNNVGVGPSGSINLWYSF